MALLKKKERSEAEIPTASMADIAFLLLIFFLVTTTIDVDTGIGMVLPPKLEDDVEPPPIRERNMLKILVNETGQVLLEDKPSAVNMIRAEVVKHVTNNGSDPNYSVSPTSAIISMKTSSQTPYNVYIQVLDEVWMGYFEIWNSELRRMGMGGITYTDAPDDVKAAIRKDYPAAISIAEPDDLE